MLKRLIGLITKAPRKGPAQKSRPVATAKPVTPGKDYRASSIVPGLKCCSAAKASVGKRYLHRDSPRVPLANCTMPSVCSCTFRKVSDRRDSERRQIGVSETGRWFAGPENRKVAKRGRRNSDGT